jgi:hypothetical protein
MQPEVSILAKTLDGTEPVVEHRPRSTATGSRKAALSAMTRLHDNLGSLPSHAVRPARRFRSFAASLLCACSLMPSAALAGSIYAQWPNGPPQNANFFAISVWWQNPAVSGKSGSYSTIGAAAAGMGINVFLGEGNWPEAFRRRLR